MEAREGKECLTNWRSRLKMWWTLLLLKMVMGQVQTLWKVSFVQSENHAANSLPLVLCRGCSSSQCFQENNPKESLVSVGWVGWPSIGLHAQVVSHTAWSWLLEIRSSREPWQIRETWRNNQTNQMIQPSLHATGTEWTDYLLDAHGLSQRHGGRWTVA